MLKDNSKETVTTAWNGFKGGDWQDEIDVRDFINRNFTPYDGDQSFLEEATEATKTLNNKLIDIKLKPIGSRLPSLPLSDRKSVV